MWRQTLCFPTLKNLEDILILYNIGGGGYLISSAPTVHVTPLETPFGLVIPLFTIPITHHYNCTQLFPTRLRIYTIIVLTRM
jgi:hypothetical protein